MPKCARCGAEFEGNFCPECGEEYKEKKVCPKCGAECGGGVKFCPKCGYSFYAAEKEAKPERLPKVYDEKTEAVYKKIHGFIEPVVLFLIFTVIVFCFFFAPVAVMPSLFGEEAESYGTLYAAFMGDMAKVGLTGPAMAAMFFALLSVPLSAVYTYFNTSPTFKYTEINFLKIYKIRVERLLEYAAWAVYLAFVIISSVMLGKISAFDGGLGLIAAGACPILLLVFSSVFLVVSVGARLFDDLVILKNFPQFKEYAKERKPIEYSPEQPVLPEEVSKPLKSENPLYSAKALLNYVAFKRACIWGAFAFYCLAVLCISLLSLETMVFGYIIYVFAILCAPLAFLRSKIFIPKKIQLKAENVAWLIVLYAIPILFMLVMIYYTFHNEELFVFSLLSIIVVVESLIFLIFYIIYAKESRIILYGEESARDCHRLTKYGKEFTAKQEVYIERINDYKLYKEQLRFYKKTTKKQLKEKELAEAGYDYENGSERLAYWGNKNKTAAKVAVCAAVAAIIAVIAVLTSIPAMAGGGFGGGSVNGTYYEYEESKKDYDKNNYIIISGNGWEDDDGEKGTFKKSGNEISFMYEEFGESFELYGGKYVSDGVIMLNIFGAKVYYCKEGKTPPTA